MRLVRDRDRDPHVYRVGVRLVRARYRGIASEFEARGGARACSAPGRRRARTARARAGRMPVRDRGIASEFMARLRERAMNTPNEYVSSFRGHGVTA